ncbi:MAG: type VII secretion integral membrane protein EccD, partial [Mycobacterium sp.]
GDGCTMTTANPTTQAPEAPRLCKVALLVGDNTLIDYALPAGVAVIAVIEDLIPRVNEILCKRGQSELDDRLTYQLCRSDATPLDVQRSLDDSGVYDGACLWLLPADATERFAPVIEEVSTALARSARQQFARVDVTTTRRVAGGMALGLVAWAELMLLQLWWQRHGWLPAAVSGALAVVLLVAARGLARARDEQRRATAVMLVWAALIAAGAGAAMAVPGPPGGWHLVAGIATGLAGVAAVAMVTGRYLGVLAGLTVIGGSGGVVAGIHASGWQVLPAHLAVVFLLVCLLLVTFATSIGVIAAGVPGPWFPSITNRGRFETAAGAPSNTVSPVAREGTETVEQISAWARRGTAIVTGLLSGTAVVLVGACRYAVIPQTAGGWRFLVFTLGICAIFLLRARSYVDRYQSVILAVAAVAGTAMVLGRYASAPVPASATVTLVCMGAALGLVIAGLLVALVIPKARINAPVNRAVEVSEYLLLILVVPWAIWLLNLLSVVRNAVHGS